MSIKQVIDKLLNKKWHSEDLIWLILIIVVMSTIATPLLGVPIGIIVYFLLFDNSDESDEEENEYELDNKK
ncbi:VraH family peptide resistance protein [Mammaliicoccus sciuri]|uniref:VraH family peptide resistance protein n=1 Tax=Mammaliicoccus sciuri TaxID=1296 RepID=UPI00226FCBC7|nr:VraH family protein [Mammaliicoccus sciuri]MCY1029451.1 VraH family protein [Mammaliicoccus sciuri]